MGLLERDDLVEAIRERVEAAAPGSGALVVVAGEAGAGKTSLVRAALPPASAAWGFCEPLSTPRPLGPFVDIARQLWPGSNRIEGLDAIGIGDCLLEGFGGASVPLIVEDGHWIDAASADVVRYLGRRIAAAGGVVVLTFRDELDPDHPLRPVLGELGTDAAFTRLNVPPLSPNAVAHLAAGSMDSGEAMRLTKGNAFLVTQLMLDPGNRVATTIRDAVAARMNRLTPAGRALVELLAVIPGRVDIALLTDRWIQLDEAARAGLVRVDGPVVEFRHELVRRAVEEELAPGRRRTVHGEVLYRLSRSDGPEPAAIAFHARHVQNRPLGLASEWRAAERALAVGAHREAAEHYERAVDDAEGITSGAERIRLWLNLSAEQSSIARDEQSLASARRAAELADSAGEVTLRIESKRWLSRLTRVETESHQLAAEAMNLATEAGSSADKAAATANLAANRMLARDLTAAVTWARQAIEWATAIDDIRSLLIANEALGSALLLSGDESGQQQLRRAIDLAQGISFDVDRGRIHSNLVSAAGEAKFYSLSMAAAEEAMAYFAARDLDAHAGYTRAWIARCCFEQGQWDRAEAEVEQVLGGVNAVTLNSELLAWCVRARIRARRGTGAIWAALGEAHRRAEVTGSLQRLTPVATARAEARWLAGHRDAASGSTDLAACYHLALGRSNPWAVGELGLWMWRFGQLDRLPAVAADPYRRHVAGDLAGAGQAWLDLGCPYEAADAWCDANDEPTVRAALDLFTKVGAHPGRRRAARRLRELGVRVIPRGPRESTRSHPHGLTEREQEVLALMQVGHTDAEIAARLHLSTRTVSHHASSVLRKTSTRSRRQLIRRD